MERHLETRTFAVVLGVLLSANVARGASTEVAPIEGQEASTLRSLTGMRSLRHKKSGLEVRLLEADGSPFVAQDPVALYLVVTNNGTSDLKEHVWRLPRGVARVRTLSETVCGIDVRVVVDGPETQIPKASPRVLHLCFLIDGHLASTLYFSEETSKHPSSKAAHLAVVPAPRTASCDDVAGDVASNGMNLRSRWSYGWSPTLADAFSAYDLFGKGLPGVQGSQDVVFWYRRTNPSVFFNPTSSDNHFGNTVTLGPGQFGLHPGPVGEYSIVRWTTPSAGRYSIKSTFLGISGYGGATKTTVDVHVRQNGKDLAAGAGGINIDGAGNSFGFDSTLDLALGDTVDFAVGQGNGSYTNDSTALTARICKY